MFPVLDTKPARVLRLIRGASLWCDFIGGVCDRTFQVERSTLARWYQWHNGIGRHRERRGESRASVFEICTQSVSTHQTTAYSSSWFPPHNF